MLRRYVIALATLLLPLGAIAAEPPTEPILRIEAGQHAAMIKRIAVDGSGRFLATASDDKTVRVWEIPAPGARGTSTPRLLRILRPPIGEGNEGKFYSVALSPDGTTVACGGWTQFNAGANTQATDGHTIYLFNRASGTMLRRITGLPAVINHLAFSVDGRFLAAALGDKNGIRVFRTSDGNEQFKETTYGDQSYGVAFDRAGRLATTSYDGAIRLYDAAFTKIATIAAPNGKRPFGLAFSPDGSRIAIGYDDSNRVDVLSGRDLSLLFSADTTGVDSLLACVAWSHDGRYLYAANFFSKKLNNVWYRMVRRWEDGGRGRFTDFPASSNSIASLAPLPDGRLAFGARDPAFGILAADGSMAASLGPENADFRDNQNGLRVTPDGLAVAFGFELWGKSPARFLAGERKLIPGSSDTAFTPPLTSHADLSVTDWQNSYAPKLNGSPLPLQHYEMSRSLAILPDGSGLVLGADWSLLLYGPDGRERWQVAAPAPVWGVNVAWQARLAVAAYGDGTIRWHRLTDGKELLAFFPHRDQKRWVLWTPSGFYDASPGGEDLIGWHVNNGKGRAADFFPASKFRASFYRPDVIARVFDTLDEAEAVKLANSEGNRRQVVASVAQSLPPVVTVISPADGSTVSAPSVTLRYAVRSPAGAPPTALKVLVDGRPVSQERGLKVVPKEGAEQSVTVAIPARDCEVSLVVENINAASVPATVRLVWSGAKQEEYTAKPRLYVLAVGVSVYKDKELSLKYAAKDAKDFAAALAKQKGGLYKDVVVKILTDIQATRDDIMDGLEWLQREVTSKDVGVVFIAGHGVNDSTGNFYYLPQNADPDRLKRTGVAFSDLKTTLNSLAGKAVLFADTCHSGNVMGARRGVADINAVVNELASAENGIVVFASSTGRQYSLEDAKWGNGAFTKALVEGLLGKADLLGKGKITINMLDTYLSDRVKELTGGRQTPTTTKPSTVPDFPLAVKR